MSVVVGVCPSAVLAELDNWLASGFVNSGVVAVGDDLVLTRWTVGLFVKWDRSSSMGGCCVLSVFEEPAAVVAGPVEPVGAAGLVTAAAEGWTEWVFCALESMALLAFCRKR